MSQVREREAPEGGQARERLLAGAPVRQVRRAVGGVSTAVLEGGEGPPVVLLHGQGAFAALSLGGQVASRFAGRDSRRLSRLVLADTPGLVGKPRPSPRTLVILVRHTARPSRRSTLALLRHLVVDADRFQNRLGERWETFLAAVRAALDPSRQG